MKTNYPFTATCFFAALFTFQLQAADHASSASWPQFRGPDGQGNSTATDVPIRFGLEQAVRWRTPIEGKGWSSPVVADGKIWLTTALTRAASQEEQERKLGDDPLKDIKEVAGAVELKALCVDFESGAIEHNISLAQVDDPEPINPLNTYASPTPVLDGQRVFCHFGNYGTWCLDARTGSPIWTTRIQVDHSVGPGSSPFVIGKHLVLVCDGIDQQFIVALDKTTGKELWRTARPPIRATNVEFKKAYSTPILVDVQGRQQLVIPGAQWICGYDPATGREIWRIDHGSGFSTSPSAVISGGLVVFSTGYMRPELVAVRPDGHGDVTTSHIIWRVSRGAPAKPSPLAVGNRIYMISDDGILTQLRSEDGSIAWRHRISGNFSASPINVSGKLFFCSHEGVVTVVADDETYQELAKNELESRLMASPAVVGNDLVIRTEQSLLRIGND